MTGSAQLNITCPKCSATLQSDIFTSLGDSKCNNCGLIMTARLFPRLFRQYEPPSTDVDTASANESTCYFHSMKSAVSHCTECGRFLCSLCELEIEGRIICPACLQRLDEEKEVKTLTHDTTFWDSIVMTISILSFLIWPISIITAPMVMIIIVKYFDSPKYYVIPRKRWRFYIAGSIAIFQISIWFFIILRFIY